MPPDLIDQRLQFREHGVELGQVDREGVFGADGFPGSRTTGSAAILEGASHRATIGNRCTESNQDVMTFVANQPLDDVKNGRWVGRRRETLRHVGFVAELLIWIGPSTS